MAMAAKKQLVAAGLIGGEDWKDAIEVVMKANENIWSTKLKDAEGLLGAKLKDRELQGKDDVASLLLHMAHAEVASWRTNLSESPENHEKALARFAIAEQKAQDEYNRCSPSNAVVSFVSSFFSSSSSSSSSLTEEEIERKKCYYVSAVILAETSVGQGNLHFKRQNFVRGAYFIRRGWKFFEDAKNVETQLQELKQLDLSRHQLAVPYSKLSFAIGMFNYAISMVPPMYRFIAEMIGFEGDREKAFRELRNTVEGKSIRTNWARMALTGINWFFLDEKEAASRELDSLLQDIPSSAILWNFSGTFQRKDGLLELSTLHYQNALKCAEELPQLQRTLEYELAHNYFLLGDYEQAIPLIEKYLKESTSVSYKAYGTYKLGFCYWVTQREKGDEERRKVISKLYSTIDQFVRATMAWDAFASRKAKEFRQRGRFTKLYEYLYTASNHQEGRLFDKTDEVLDKADALIARSVVEEEGGEDQPSPDEVAWCSYLRGVNFKERGQHAKEAEEHLLKAAKLAKKATVETWIRPYAEVELTELYLKELKDPSKASKHLRKSEKGSKYDFAKQAHMKITKLKAQLQKLERS